MTSITTANVREFIAKRQTEPTVATKAREITLKNGTLKRISERSRKIERVLNAEINRELIRAFNKAWKVACVAAGCPVAR
jgi:hypothetical protein